MFEMKYITFYSLVVTSLFILIYVLFGDINLNYSYSYMNEQNFLNTDLKFFTKYNIGGILFLGFMNFILMLPFGIYKKITSKNIGFYIFIGYIILLLSVSYIIGLLSLASLATFLILLNTLFLFIFYKIVSLFGLYYENKIRNRTV